VNVEWERVALKNYLGKMKFGLNSVWSRIGTFNILILIVLLISVFSTETISASTHFAFGRNFIVGSVTQIPVSLLHLILTMLGLALIICFIVIVFSRKLKKVNLELKSKNIEIESVNKSERANCQGAI
jgi:predicted membrane protein